MRPGHHLHIIVFLCWIHHSPCLPVHRNTVVIGTIMRNNYGYYHEKAGPNHFCKVIFAPKLEALSLPLHFTKHFPAMFSPNTNTGFSWRVTVKVVDDGFTLDQGCTTFTGIHHVGIGYKLTFKLLTPNTMKVMQRGGGHQVQETRRGLHRDRVNDLLFLVPCCGLFF
ncbi:Cohesin subunit SA-1 [Hordeum vulgare]|nr:Cohesin subunit SA-1 [Hordeum vulgare]